jgi:hypothetical protein
VPRLGEVPAQARQQGLGLDPPDVLDPRPHEYKIRDEMSPREQGRQDGHRRQQEQQDDHPAQAELLVAQVSAVQVEVAEDCRRGPVGPALIGDKVKEVSDKGVGVIVAQVELVSPSPSASGTCWSGRS